MFFNSDKIFDDVPTTQEERYRNSLRPVPLPKSRDSSSNFGTPTNDVNIEGKAYLYPQPCRLLRGASHYHAADKTISYSKAQPADIKFFDSKNEVNVISLQLNSVKTKGNSDGVSLSRRHSNVVIKKTHANQQLFRESSAQTLPHLPGISYNHAELDALKIFKLPIVLTKNDPHGFNEIETLEKSRKRFEMGLKRNNRRQLKASKRNVKPETHDNTLKAFEWENWIHFETNMQECQMQRLKLVIQMFDKRERDILIASKIKIQKSYQNIEVERKAALKRSETMHKRSLGVLNAKRKKQLRDWRKASISQRMGGPSSEFYAPQMRYGVNPNRLNYVPSFKNFDMLIDSQEKKAILMDSKNINCPMSKLRTWSRPKEISPEMEKNFCSDANLNILYNNIKVLREFSKIQKHTPLCLKIKKPEEFKQLIQIQTQADRKKDKSSMDVPKMYTSHEYQRHFQSKHQKFFEELHQQKHIERLDIGKQQNEMRCEDLEALISSYQGNSIGWLMRFFTEEMGRLKQQRSLQFQTMIFKSKRWRREAAEAGLRQKEKCMRCTYKKIYEECNTINKEITQLFVDSILKKSIKDSIRKEAEHSIAVLAQDLDKEISCWLESFGDVQNPLSYQTLRKAIKDIVMANRQNFLFRFEMVDCIDFILHDVVLKKVFNGSDSCDISLSLAIEFVDRLINSDLLLNSHNCRLNCKCTARCKCDVFQEAMQKDYKIEVDMKTQPHIFCLGAYTNLICHEKDANIEDFLESSPLSLREDKVELKLFNPECKICADEFTKSLKWSEKLLLTDPDKLPSDDYVVKKDEYILPNTIPKLSTLHNIPSYHDLSIIEIFHTTPIFAQTSSEELLEGMCLEQEREIREEASLLNSSWEEMDLIEQLGEEEQAGKQKEQGEKFEINNNSVEKSFLSVEEIHQPTNIVKENAKQTTIRGTSVELIAPKSKSKQTIQISDEPVVENSSGSFMRVSFTYDPQLNFSVAMPRSEDDDEKSKPLNGSGLKQTAI